MKQPTILLACTLLATVSLACTALGAAEEKQDQEQESSCPTDADFQNHAAALAQRLVGEPFTIVIERPFVVIGDESAEEVRARASGTIRWTVRALKASYFENDPPDIIEIWLFRDEESYRHNAQRFFGEEPDTPFGYYCATHRALVMNIATGGGTLVHEMIHPFMAANFPHCPSWFNEGLGSLYEQCCEIDGQIHGQTNWRLAGLQKAIRERRLGSFQSLCASTTDEFYGPGQGVHYAQARYLCYYLQEKGLLQKFYRQFRTDCESDPTGYETLKAILGQQDMNAFTAQWMQFTLSLNFP